MKDMMNGWMNEGHDEWMDEGHISIACVVRVSYGGGALGNPTSYSWNPVQMFEGRIDMTSKINLFMDA